MTTRINDREASNREWLEHLERVAHNRAQENDLRRREHRPSRQIYLEPEEVSQLVDWAKKGLGAT